jgi:transposase
LNSVLTDVMGKNGRTMIDALIGGETNLAKLASLAHPRVKASPEKLREASSRPSDQAPSLPAAPSSQSDRRSMRKWRPILGLSHRSRVDPVDPGIKNLSAQVIVSEIGIDMSRFPSAAHLISWACICPRNDESAGKRRSTRVRKGANWLKATLVRCALAAAKEKGSYLQAQFYRLKARRGPKKAIMAVVASILTAIYHMLKDGTMYQDLGCDHFKRHSADQKKRAWSSACQSSAMR